MPRVAVNGVRLNVTELAARGGKGKAHGDQTPTVFIHGLAASSAFWFAAGAQFTTILGPVLMYDLRGHGKSDTPDSGYTVTDQVEDLICLLDANGIRRANLVAHSFGGMIALLCALKHPERVASLVLADVRVRSVQTKLDIRSRSIPEALEQRLIALGIDIDELTQSDDGIGYLNTVARIQVAAGDEANKLLTALYQHPRLFKSMKNARKWIALTETATLVSDIKSEQTFAPKDLARITVPMLILVGKESPTLRSAQAMSSLCPRAIYHELPGVGHFFPISNPRMFLRPTLRFLRSVNRSGGRVHKRFV